MFRRASGVITVYKKSIRKIDMCIRTIEELQEDTREKQIIDIRDAADLRRRLILVRSIFTGRNWQRIWMKYVKTVRFTCLLYRSEE